MDKMTNSYKFSRKSEGKRSLGDHRRKWEYSTNLGRDIGPVMGTYEHGNEPSGSIKGGEFNKRLTDYLFLKNASAPRVADEERTTSELDRK
jgi:hypothetical protein